MKLDNKRTIYVGFAFFLICAFWQAYDTIIPKILTDKFGMSQSWSGVIMGIDNVLALFMLPLFGSLSDKCTSKRGRRTPFIAAGTIAAVVFMMLLSVADGMQIKQIEAVAPTNPTALETLYDAKLTIQTPTGKELFINEEFTREEFCAIPITDENGKTTDDFTNYVRAPSRQRRRFPPLCVRLPRSPFAAFPVRRAGRRRCVR